MLKSYILFAHHLGKHRRASKVQSFPRDETKREYLRSQSPFALAINLMRCAVTFGRNIRASRESRCFCSARIERNMHPETATKTTRMQPKTRARPLFAIQH